MEPAGFRIITSLKVVITNSKVVITNIKVVITILLLKFFFLLMAPIELRSLTTNVNVSLGKQHDRLNYLRTTKKCDQQ